MLQNYKVDRYDVSQIHMLIFLLNIESPPHMWNSILMKKTEFHSMASLNSTQILAIRYLN